MKPRYRHRILGLNARLDALQAAVLRVKLRHLDRWNAARRAHAAEYRRLLDARRVTRVGAAEWVRESLFETGMLPLIHAPEPSKFVF